MNEEENKNGYLCSSAKRLSGRISKTKSMELIDFIIRLLAATASGGALGIEREQNNKSAGLHPYLGVCKCLHVCINIFAYHWK